MFIHPSIQTKITRQRQRELLARSERHRIAKPYRAGQQEDRGGWLIGRRALYEWSLPTARRAPRLSA